jgi:uncharacterized repeat protein (TIGR03987 family)
MEDGNMLIYAIIFITLALVYTLGVMKTKELLNHGIWDYSCCSYVIPLAHSLWIAYQTVRLSKSGFNLHGITGVIAIALMLIHAIWAAVVLVKKNDDMILKFHRFSIIVWIIWLVPFISGTISHMK